MLEPLIILSISIAILLGHYSVFSLIFEKNFITRFKKFKEELDSATQKFQEKFYEEVQSKIVKKEKPNRFVDFVHKWSNRQSSFENLQNSYYQLGKLTKVIYFIFTLAIIGSLGSIMYPDYAIDVLMPGNSTTTPLHLIEVANYLFFGGIFLVLYYIWRQIDISSKLSKFELGTRIEDII